MRRESKLQHSITKELLKGTGVHKEMDCGGGGGGGGGDVIRRLILPGAAPQDSELWINSSSLLRRHSWTL